MGLPQMDAMDGTHDCQAADNKANHVIRRVGRQTGYRSIISIVQVALVFVHDEALLFSFSFVFERR